MGRLARERLLICQACQHFRGSIMRCKICGCLMVIKARMKNAACPIGKW